MADKLGIYNGALRLCRERKIKDLTENRKPRRMIDDVFADKNPVDYCLEQAQWQWATRTIKFEIDDGVETDFGYLYAFKKPDDYVRVVAVSFDEYFSEPIHNYADEADYFYADSNILYVKYVSKSDNYGNDMGLWPLTFQNLVEAFIAMEIVGDLTNSSRIIDMVEQTYMKRLNNAQNKDGVNRPTQ